MQNLHGSETSFTFRIKAFVSIHFRPFIFCKLLGNNDHVECFYCGVNLANWEPHNEPWEEHARHSPLCHWLMEQKGKRFIDAVTKKYVSLATLSTIPIMDLGFLFQNNVSSNHPLLTKLPQEAKKKKII